MTSDALSRFLTARLDELQLSAQWSGPAQVAWLTYRDADGKMLYTTPAAGSEGDVWMPWAANGQELPEPASARVVYEPDRVLRRVAAYRLIVASYETALGEYRRQTPNTCPSPSCSRSALSLP